MTGRLAIGLLFAAALLHLGEFAAIRAKGVLGQWLMERAWADSASSEAAPRPWPGARTGPAARLYVPELKIDRLVVRGLDTPNLAWGPGIETGPNGHTVIAAHRDTHFSFLGRLESGHTIELEQPPGESRRWRVDHRRIVDARTTRLDLDAPGPLLTLVTCWPIDAVEAGGPLRLVVSAVPADGNRS